MLNESDADQINRRRTSSQDISTRIEADKWPLGAQAHIGNRAEAGQVYPMVIIRVWDDDEVSSVQGQVFLDGNDTFWAISRSQVAEDSTDKQGHWFAPPRV